MRLYLTVWDEGPACLYYGKRFTGTQKDQAAVEKEVRAAGFTLLRSEVIEVPDDKAGRIKFYNEFQLVNEEDET